MERYKEKEKNPFYRKLLELEEMVREGKKEKALSEIDNMIQELRGLKLLSVTQYKKNLLLSSGN